jgi:hypothetical protein
MVAMDTHATFVNSATVDLFHRNSSCTGAQRAIRETTTSMTLHPSRMKAASAAQRRAAASEFCTSHGRYIDDALKLSLERGRRLRAREESWEYVQDQVDALEMLTQIPLLKDGTKLTGAAWVLIAIHVVLPLYMLNLFGHDLWNICKSLPAMF